MTKCVWTDTFLQTNFSGQIFDHHKYHHSADGFAAFGDEEMIFEALLHIDMNANLVRKTFLDFFKSKSLTFHT